MVQDVICNHCGSDIKRVYVEEYNGIRGRCTTCGIDFPLE